jgi:hypothetical protein
MAVGSKYDAQKPRLSLFPTHVIQAIVGVLEYGAEKYTLPISKSPADSTTAIIDHCTCDVITPKDLKNWAEVERALDLHTEDCYAYDVVFVRDNTLWRSGDGNWRLVKHARKRYYDAMNRHVTDWWTRKETIDPTSGHHHLAHALCCLVFLLALEMEKEQEKT